VLDQHIAQIERLVVEEQIHAAWPERLSQQTIRSGQRQLEVVIAQEQRDLCAGRGHGAELRPDLPTRFQDRPQLRGRGPVVRSEYLKRFFGEEIDDVAVDDQMHVLATSRLVGDRRQEVRQQRASSIGADSEAGCTADMEV
jgi:hypothetical protein